MLYTVLKPQRDTSKYPKIYSTSTRCIKSLVIDKATYRFKETTRLVNLTYC